MHTHILKVFIYLLVLLFADIASSLEIKSNSYLLIDVNSQTILAEKQADLQLPPASITKIMTALVVFEEIKSGRINLADMVLISKNAAEKGGSKMFIVAGSVVSVHDLLKGMIVSSGNDASIALAEYIAGSEQSFAQLMNKIAQELGMSNTNFKNSTGWPDDEHYSTSRDIAVMTGALITQFPEFYKIFKQKNFTYGKSSKGIPIVQQNRNGLLWSNGIHADGVKTGHTKAAGYCLVGSVIKQDMRLVSVIMKTLSKKSRVQESEKLLNYGFKNFSTKKMLSKNKVIMTVPIWQGNKDKIKVGVVNDVFLTVSKQQINDIKTKIKVNKNILAPLPVNSEIGKISFTIDGKILRQEPLTTLEPVKSGTFLHNLFDSIMLFLS